MTGVLGPGDTVEGWALYLTAVAAGVGAVIYLLRALVRVGRWAREGWRRARAVLDLIEHELTPNHGGSMKDNLTAIARGLGSAQARLDAIERRLGIANPHDRRHHQ
jgi:hypothetical protein